ncbi:MAG: nucleoside kinase [Clostridiales bacterium]|nr:nucleoside kinase [Clostridiales bacterium]
MEIIVNTGPKSDRVVVSVPTGTKIEELAGMFKQNVPFRILAAKVDNKVEELSKALNEPCTVELLDMRDPAANLIYQHSLTLIYLKAVNDIFGNVRVDIKNSINKGIYTSVKLPKLITEEQIKSIENRMQEMVSEDMPLVRKSVTREEGFKILTADGQTEKARLLARDTGAEWVRFYYLGSYKDFFYGLMAPSAGYLEHFELRKYKNGVLIRFPHPSAPNIIPEYVDEVKLYEAFSEATKWSKILGTSFVADLNEKTQNGQYKELIQLSEALHEKKTAEIADMITTEKKRIVLIAGPSSSGKTTFAKRLCIQLRVNGKEPLYLSTDDYFVERDMTPLDENGEPDFEGLSAIEVRMFNEHMNALLQGEEVDIPTFDFIKGTKVFGKRASKIKNGQPIVIEGIHALNDAMTPAIERGEKFKIYISPFTQLNIDNHNRIPVTDGRMLRRMVRDYQFRGHSAQGTIRGWSKVRAGEDKNIFPYSNEADVFFNSAHVYELAVLKKYAEPLLAAVKPDEQEYCEAVRLLKFLRFFETIEDDSIIVNNSIMREFIGGSIFV